MTPRVHHVSCGSMCPLAGRLIGAAPPTKICCHVLVIETDGGIVLVDTGFGTADVADPRRLPRTLRAISRPVLDPSETALARVTALGLAPRDVRAIVCTHLDLDHAGGLADFPEAAVHVMADEHLGATTRATFLERRRYVPAQLAHGPRWVLHRAGGGSGETWRGFDAVRALGPEFGAELLLVPLGGHTRGHAGVAVRHADGWLLHAGDAYFHHQELARDPDVPIGLSAYQRMIAFDDSLRRANQERLRMLVQDAAADLQVICAHDPAELERAQAARFSATPGPALGVD